MKGVVVIGSRFIKFKSKHFNSSKSKLVGVNSKDRLILDDYIIGQNSKAGGKSSQLYMTVDSVGHLGGFLLHKKSDKYYFNFDFSVENEKSF